MKTVTVILFLAVAAFAQTTDKSFDDKLAKDAVAVLRVHKFHEWLLPKYPFHRYTVHVHEIFKNESRDNLMHDFDIHCFKDMSGIPEGECTVYISRYDVANKRFDKEKGTIWMLVGGSATNGVSHVDSKAGFR